MDDPYEVLGVAAHADEATIRQRYLDLVREFPPDRAPERFVAIRAAYDEVRDPARVLGARLFRASTSDSLDALAADLRRRLIERRLPPEVLFSLADAP
jgi:curved DNA-binding protein CbpA